MRKPSIPDLIYQKTFPRPKQGEPASFFAHVQRHIVGEVRVEVQTYYGALDTLEAQYPGLDYTYPPHRRRMSRYQWHRRLFRVFDELALTKEEILSLCQWEGTRAAKERYEREAETEVKTTTAHDVAVITRGPGPRAVFEDWSNPASEEHSSDSGTVMEVGADLESNDSTKACEDVDSTYPAPSTEILELLRTAVQSRSSHEATMATTQAWEQWLKEALERHDVDVDSVMVALQHIQAESVADSEEAEIQTTSLDTPPEPLDPGFVATSPSEPRTYGELHAMVDQLQSDNSRLAADNAALALFLSRTQAEAAR